jgi:type IV secretion system protein TrbL
MLAALGIPSIPGVACPAAAGALGAAGLGPICQAAGGIAGAAANQVAGFGVSSILDAISGWVAAGGVWLLGQIGTFMDATTTVDLGASWFTSHYQTMAGLAGVVIVPMLLLGVMQAIHRQSASMLIRSVALNVPLALLLTAVAVKLVQLGLALTDAMSATVAHGAGLDSAHFFGSTVTALSGPTTGGPVTPTFVVLLGGLAVVFGAFLLWVELLIRSAAVYVAVLFLPLALASLAWPAIAHWCRRLVDTLAALILGKFVIVSVLSLAVGALAGGSGSTPAGSTGAGAGEHGSFSDVLGGAALLMLAAFAPWALFRLLPFLEAGAVSHLEGAGRRTLQAATGPPKSLAQTAMRFSAGGAAGGAGEVGMAMASAVGGESSEGGAGEGGGTAGSGSPLPDLGRSSVEKNRVGTATPPGASVHKRTPQPKAGHAFNAVMRGEAPSGEEDTSGSAGLPSGSQAAQPLTPKT